MELNDGDGPSGVDLAWELPEVSKSESVRARASMIVGRDPHNRNQLQYFFNNFWLWHLHKALQCTFPATLDRSEGIVHFVVTDCKVHIRFAEVTSNTVPTVFYYLCCCLPGHYCCGDENHTSVERKDYIFAPEEVNFASASTSATRHEHWKMEEVWMNSRDAKELRNAERVKGSMLPSSDEDGNSDDDWEKLSKYVMLEERSQQTVLHLGFRTRYGELIPNSEWGRDLTTQRSFMNLTFNGVWTDHDEGTRLIDALSVFLAHNRTGHSDRHAAPMHGSGSDKSSNTGNYDIGNYRYKIRFHPLLGTVRLDYGDFSRGPRKVGEPLNNLHKRLEVESKLSAGDRFLRSGDLTSAWKQYYQTIPELHQRSQS